MMVGEKNIICDVSLEMKWDEISHFFFANVYAFQLQWAGD